MKKRSHQPSRPHHTTFLWRGLCEIIPYFCPHIWVILRHTWSSLSSALALVELRIQPARQSHSYNLFNFGGIAPVTDKNLLPTREGLAFEAILPPKRGHCIGFITAKYLNHFSAHCGHSCPVHSVPRLAVLGGAIPVKQGCCGSFSYARQSYPMKTGLRFRKVKILDTPQMALQLEKC